jgi:hypothetical protein
MDLVHVLIVRRDGEIICKYLRPLLARIRFMVPQVQNGTWGSRRDEFSIGNIAL